MRFVEWKLQRELKRLWHFMWYVLGHKLKMASTPFPHLFSISTLSSFFLSLSLIIIIILSKYHISFVTMVIILRRERERERWDERIHFFLIFFHFSFLSSLSFSSICFCKKFFSSGWSQLLLSYRWIVSYMITVPYSRFWQYSKHISTPTYYNT